MKKIIHVVVELVETTLIAACFLTACSSAPKRSMQVSTVYSSASEMIESANGAILTGDYDKAGFNKLMDAVEQCWKGYDIIYRTKTRDDKENEDIIKADKMLDYQQQKYSPQLSYV